MTLFSRVPLAWKNLSYRPARLVVSQLGISFAVLLIFVQVGFWGALLDSVVRLSEHTQAELVIVSRAKLTLAFTQPFPLARLGPARPVPGVVKVEPLYVNRGSWRSPESPDPLSPFLTPRSTKHFIRVVACDLTSGSLVLPEVADYAQALREPGTALIDSQSRPEFGVRSGEFTTELNGQPLRILHTFTLGTDFAANGTLIMDRDSYDQFFGGPGASPLQEVEVGLVSLDRGANPAAVQDALAGVLPEDVQVLTHAEFVLREKRYWLQNTPAGFVFSVGLILGFVVGVVICSHILSSDVTEHLGEYATLKAIGYSNARLLGVILQQALWLSVLGFLPGWLMSMLVYSFLGSLTGLPMALTPGRSMTVLLFTVLMCVLPGLFAARKVWAADPVEVF